MERIKKSFGFGCMQDSDEWHGGDQEETQRMVDAFLDIGFNYFDTAHG